MSYSLVFARFPVTRNVPWVNFLLFGISAALLFLGFRRILRDVQSFLGKIVGSIVIFLSVSIFCIFCYVIFLATKQLPASIRAPRIGQKAPQFALRDTQANSASLETLLSTPLDQSNPSPLAPKRVLLIFSPGFCS